MTFMTDSKIAGSGLTVMRTPRSVEVEITSRCNLTCRYCYYFGNSSIKYADLPAEEWCRFFSELGQCAVMSVTLQGGEPFIRDDLPELLQGIVRSRMRFFILSNGTLITGETARFLAQTGRCDGVQVSIDGSCAKVHDAFRGNGAFEKAVRGIQILQDHGILVTVRVTVHRMNYHDLQNIAHFLLSDLNLEGVSVNSAAYMGVCRVNAGEVMLTVSERGHAMQTLVDLADQYDNRITGTAGPLAEARMWHDMETARQNNAPPFPDRGYLTGCGCSFSKIAVRADGVIVPCSLMAEIELGRINRDSLTDVWQNSPALNRLRKRRRIPLTEFEFCKGCPYIPYCTGNCPGLAFSRTRRVNHPDPDGCLRGFLEQKGRLPVMGGRCGQG